MKSPRISIYCGTLFISCGALLLEVALCRILSVSHWYHYAFMVISLSLLGFGASGTLLSFLRPWVTARPHSWIVLFCCLFSASSVLCYQAFDAIGFEEVLFSWRPGQLCLLGSGYLILALPFLFAGCTVGTAISSYPSHVGRVYFFSLTGSGLGCALVIPAFAVLGGTNVVLGSAAVGLGAAALVSFPSLKKEGGLALVALACLLWGMGYHPSLLPLSVSEFKAYSMFGDLPGASVEESRWNAISRVDVVRSRYIRIAPGGMSLLYGGRLPEQLAMTVDGDSPSPINKVVTGKTDLSFLDRSPSSLPYAVAAEGPGVLVIGPGGGGEVWNALRHGAARVTAVEVNPLVVEMVGERYGVYAGDIFGAPEVEVVVDEGRSYSRRTEEMFDVVSITLLDSLAAASAGVHSLSENYLYTTGSLRDLYGLLSERGLISITRWLKVPPTDSVRLFATAVEALRDLGMRDVASHLAFIRSWSTGTVLISKSGFTGEDVAAIKEFCFNNCFDLVHIPGMRRETANRYNVLEKPYYYDLASALLTDFDGTIDGYPFDIAPPTDDRPFFYNTFRFKSLSHIISTMGTGWLPFVEWGYLVLMGSLAQALLFSVLLIMLPLLSFRRSWKGAPKCGVITYFSLIGVGFMTIEISMIQRFILFLGHPAYSMPVILGGMLVSCGVGSAVAGKAASGRVGCWRTAAAFAIACLAVLYALGLPCLFAALRGMGLAQRAAITLALVFPLGFAMGFPFPLGVRSFASRHPSLVPLAWGSNGCASVVGAILAVVMAISVGFTLTTVVAAALYLGAAAIGKRVEAFPPCGPAEGVRIKKVAARNAAAGMPSR